MLEHISSSLIAFGGSLVHLLLSFKKKPFCFHYDLKLEPSLTLLFLFRLRLVRFVYYFVYLIVFGIKDNKLEKCNSLNNFGGTA